MRTRCCWHEIFLAGMVNLCGGAIFGSLLTPDGWDWLGTLAGAILGGVVTWDRFFRAARPTGEPEPRVAAPAAGEEE